MFANIEQIQNLFYSIKISIECFFFLSRDFTIADVNLSCEQVLCAALCIEIYFQSENWEVFCIYLALNGIRTASCYDFVTWKLSLGMNLHESKAIITGMNDARQNMKKFDGSSIYAHIAIAFVSKLVCFQVHNIHFSRRFSFANERIQNHSKKSFH